MNKQKHEINLIIVDDHRLFREGLKGLIESLDKKFKVTHCFGSGVELLSALPLSPMPDLVLMDMNMKEMDGFNTSKKLLELYPEMKILVISMIQQEEAIVKMLRMGIKGYLSKDVEPEELEKAIYSILQKGYYFTDFITGALISNMSSNAAEQSQKAAEFTEREMEFIRMCFTDLAYKEIANEMKITIKALDGDRNNIFKKMNVKNRVGVILYAIKNRLVTIDI